VRAGLVLIASFLILSCVTVKPPLEEYAIARAAVEAAQNVQSARHSPGYWHQAEEAYRKGQLYYKDRDYKRARDEFIRARVAAEKAENSARLLRQKSGEVL
jgi:hypothetical protein